MAEWSLGLAELGTQVSLDGLNKGIDKAEKAASSGFSKIGDILSGALKVGLLGAAAGFVALGGAIASGVGDAREAVQLLAATEQVIKTTGAAAGVTTQQVVDLATALSASKGQSLFGDDQIQSAENVLLTFTEISKDVFPDVTKVTLDMAQALHKTPEAMAMMTGKAFNSAEGFVALKRSGVAFTDSQEEQIKTLFAAGKATDAQRIILAELNKEFGGQAAAAAAADGGWAQFKDRMGEAAETAGGALLPVLGMVASVANDVIAPAIETAAQAFGDLVGYFSAVAEDGDYLNDFLGNLPASIQPAVQFIGELAAAFGTGSADGGGLVGGLTNALYSLDAISPLFDVLGDTINAVADGGIQVLIDKLAEISPGFAILRGIVEAALPPIQDIVLSVIGIITGFLAEHGQTMLADVQNTWAAIQGVIDGLLPPIQITVTTVFGVIQTFLHAHGADIQAFLGETWDAIFGIINTALPLIQGVITGVLAIIVGFIRDHGAQIQQVLGDTWNIVKNIISGALAIIQGLLSAALAIFKGDWAGAWDAIQQMSVTVTEKLGSIIKDGLDIIAAFFGTTVDDIVRVWSDLGKQAIDIGGKIVQGIITGVKNAASSLYHTLEDLANDAVQAAKDALGISSPSKEFAAIGQFAVLGLLAGFQNMWPQLTAEVGAMGEGLVDQMGSIAEKVQGIVADAFGATATIDRQVAANLDKLKDVLPQYLNYTTGALKEAETKAGEFLDPDVGAKYFKMRSDQILEYAKLQKELSEAATQEDKDRISAQMLLINKAQQAEIDAFNAGQVGAQSPTQGLWDKINAMIADISKNPIPDEQIQTVNTLSGLLAQLSTPTVPVRALYDPTAPGPVVGTINITQLPGEDAQALAERVMRVIEQRTGGRI